MNPVIGDMGNRTETLHPELLIPAGDEVVAASRYEPASRDGPSPVILIVTPYRKDDRITFGAWYPSIRYFCRHGYEVVVADLIGTGASSGNKRPFHREEGDEIATVIKWLADREWCTGDIGMFGLSYGAWTQYVTAAVNPEPLKTIVPVSVSNAVYESSCTGGVVNPMKRATWSVLMQTLRALPPSRRDDDGRWADVWHGRLTSLEENEPWLFRFLGHESHDEFWNDRVVSPEEIRVPTFAACGYRDTHTAPMVEFFDEIEAPSRLLLGPWRHRMPEQGREVAINYRRQVVEWFDHFLKGERTNTLSRPTVTYWTERDGGWTPGAGTWRATDRWPIAERASTITYAVTPDGLSPSETYSEGQFDQACPVDHTVGVESLDRVGRVTNEGEPTNGDDARSLTVETTPLTDPLEWTGTGSATIRIRPTASDSIVAVRISDVDPAGRARLVTAGHLRASHRDGHDDPTPLEPGNVSSVTVPLKPKSHIFEPGHRLRVAVSGAYFPRALPLRNSGPFDIVSTPAAPSDVTFPGRRYEGEANFDDCLQFDGPDTTVPIESPCKSIRESSWSVERDYSADVATLTTDTASTIDLPHDAEMRTDTAMEATAAADDPTRASLRTEVTAELCYDTEVVRAKSAARASRDHVNLTTTVTVDGQSIFDRTWRRPHPTDGTAHGSR